MNWSAVAAIISCITLLIVVLGGAHFSGKLVEKVNNHSEQIGDLETRADGHDSHLARIDLALVKLEQYQAGFTTAATIMSTNPQERSYGKTTGT